jgi:translocation and assembly module TamB
MSAGSKAHFRRADPRPRAQRSPGIFFRAPKAELDYRPLSYFRNHIDIQSLTIPEARLHRLAALRAADPNAPLLPDIDIDVGRLRIDRLLVDPPVTGRRHLLSIDSTIKIADGSAQLALDLAALAAPAWPAATGCGCGSTRCQRPIG